MSTTKLSRHHWQADADALTCSHPECPVEFGSIRIRRHHCRLCGQVFCGQHVGYKMRLRNNGGDGRVVRRGGGVQEQQEAVVVVHDPRSPYAKLHTVCVCCYRSREVAQQALGRVRNKFDAFRRRRHLRLRALAEEADRLELNLSALFELRDPSSRTQQQIAVRWVPDVARPVCQCCAAVFGFTRRRHHCRTCGGVVCASCYQPVTHARPTIEGGIAGYLLAAPKAGSPAAAANTRALLTLPTCDKCCHIREREVRLAVLALARQHPVHSAYTRLLELRTLLETQLLNWDLLTGQLLTAARTRKLHEATRTASQSDLARAHEATAKSMVLTSGHDLTEAEVRMAVDRLRAAHNQHDAVEAAVRSAHEEQERVLADVAQHRRLLTSSFTAYDEYSKQLTTTRKDSPMLVRVSGFTDLVDPTRRRGLSASGPGGQQPSAAAAAAANPQLRLAKAVRRATTLFLQQHKFAFVARMAEAQGTMGATSNPSS